MWLADSAIQPYPSELLSLPVEVNSLPQRSHMPTLTVPARGSDSCIVELMQAVGIHMTDSKRVLSYAQVIAELDESSEHYGLAAAILGLMVERSLPLVVNFEIRSTEDMEEYILLRLAIYQASNIHLFPAHGPGALSIQSFSVAQCGFWVCMTSGNTETIAVLSAATVLGSETTYFMFPPLCPEDTYGVIESEAQSRGRVVTSAKAGERSGKGFRFPRKIIQRAP